MYYDRGPKPYNPGCIIVYIWVDITFVAHSRYSTPVYCNCNHLGTCIDAPQLGASYVRVQAICKLHMMIPLLSMLANLSSSQSLKPQVTKHMLHVMLGRTFERGYGRWQRQMRIADQKTFDGLHTCTCMIMLNNILKAAAVAWRRCPALGAKWT